MLQYEEFKCLLCIIYITAMDFYYESPEKPPISLCIIMQITFHLLHYIQTEGIKIYRNDIALSLKFILKLIFYLYFWNIKESNRIIYF